MKAVVVHDERGQIISLTFPQPRAGTGVGVKLRPGEALLELDIPDHLIKGSLADVLKEYRVAVAEKRLVRAP
jgi:hypothetical protein